MAFIVELFGEVNENLVGEGMKDLQRVYAFHAFTDALDSFKVTNSQIGRISIHTTEKTTYVYLTRNSTNVADLIGSITPLKNLILDRVTHF